MPRVPHPQRSAGLFAETDSPAKSAPAAYRANIDGGSRGNPGPASYGVVIRDPQGEVVAKLKKYIGRMTNNVAEYYGLIAALDYAQAHAIRALRVECDSELLVKQIRGQYKVKSAELRPLFERARKMSQALHFFRIEHVYREQNREADALANEALDESSGKKPAGAELRHPKNETGNASPGSNIRDANSGTRVRARFQSGVLYPLEIVDLDDGAVVEVTIRAITKS
jgi:ribonuclease HI